MIKKKSIKLLCLSLIFNTSLYAENVNNPSISALVFFAYSDNEEMESFAVERVDQNRLRQQNDLRYYCYFKVF